MNFGDKKTVEASGVSNELAGIIYPENTQDSKIGNDFVTLEKICNVFSNRASLHAETARKHFTCYVETKAYDDFVSFANEIYKSSRHEATGLIVGYYLYDKVNPDSKFIVGTNFLRATGNNTNVTCEFSYQDSIDHSDFCNKHQLQPLIWIHSHPNFGAFYSGTDSNTLQSLFYANHQMGVVVDNIRQEVLGYKMNGENMRKEDVFLFDLDKSDAKHIEYKLLSKKNLLPPPVEIANKRTEVEAEATTLHQAAEPEAAEAEQEVTAAVEPKVQAQATEEVKNEITVPVKRQNKSEITDKQAKTKRFLMYIIFALILLEIMTLFLFC